MGSHLKGPSFFGSVLPPFAETIDMLELAIELADGMGANLDDEEATESLDGMEDSLDEGREDSLDEGTEDSLEKRRKRFLWDVLLSKIIWRVLP